MTAVYYHLWEVTACEIDEQGHANNVVFVSRMQEAAVAHSARQGWNFARYRAEDCGWVARSHQIRYLAPALLRDQIVIQTWVTGFRKATSKRRYRFIRMSDGLCLAEAETEWAFVTLSTGIPRRIPEQVSSSFEPLDLDAPPLDLPPRPNC